MSDTTPQNHPETPLEKLKAILLTEESARVAELRQEIKSLRGQLENKERLIQTLNPVLAEALEKKISQSRDEMADVLAPVMGAAIKKQVHEAKEDVVDALYPVIGRMISKAVAESMKKLAASINERVNETFDFKLLITKIKAKLFGLNAGEMILAEKGSSRLEEVFLIDKRSGLLIAQAGAFPKKGESDDSQVIAGMLTAIKMFVEDAFSSAKEGELQEIAYSDRTIRIDPGRNTYLAAVFSGVPGADFNAQLQRTHEKIHSKFYKQLRNYQGDISHLAGVHSILEEFFSKFK
ncbi:MAG: hypothetical protein GWP10_18105 [Nitrospiraceae bacterium]|nr:hypothetical protein [Nitrospiraceae bacterium]